MNPKRFNSPFPRAIGRGASVLLGLFVVMAGCSHQKTPSTMRNEKIYFSNQLRIGVFDYGSHFDRSGLEQCPQAFPAVKILGETYIHRVLSQAGINPEILAGYGDEFAPYQTLKGLHLLLIAFRENEENYLRVVNYLGQYVTTVVLDLERPTCEDIFRAQRIVAIESHPPLADINLNGRKTGESPLWVWLRDGSYRVECELPGQIFNPIQAEVPRDVYVQCKRENVESKAQVEEFHKMSGEEKAGSVLVYIVGAAASLTAIILPFFLFF